MSKLSKIGAMTFIIGFLLLISIYVFPTNFLSPILGSLRWGGLVSVFINPLLGLIGALCIVIQYFKSKRLHTILLSLNICLLFSFPLVWIVTSLFLP